MSNIVGLNTGKRQADFARQEALELVGKAVCVGVPLPGRNVRPDDYDNIGTLGEIVGIVESDKARLLVSFCSNIAKQMGVRPVTIEIDKTEFTNHLYLYEESEDRLAFTRSEAEGWVGGLVQLKAPCQGYRLNATGKVVAAVSEYDLVLELEDILSRGDTSGSASTEEFRRILVEDDELEHELKNHFMIRIQMDDALDEGDPYLDLFQCEVDQVLSRIA